MDWPEVKYARSGDLSIAYQVTGEGPGDLVFVPFLLSPIFSWLVPEMAVFFGRLASFSRLIVFDKRGTGASDRPRVLPTLEVQMDDIRAVLDDLGSEETALFGAGAGGRRGAAAARQPPRGELPGAAAAGAGGQAGVLGAAAPPGVDGPGGI